MAGIDTRDTESRTADRLRGLASLSAVGYEEHVRDALQSLWLRSGAPDTVAVRWQLVRRDPPWPGDPSDNRLPPKPERPPLARVISPRGLAVRLYLTALFVARCSVRRGVEYRNEMPLAPHTTGSLGWSELVAAPAQQSPTDANRQATARDNRVRQLKSALRALAADHVRLIGLSTGTRLYEGFRVNHEGSSAGMADDVPYTVPKKHDAVLPVGANFFLNGWQHALTDSEIVAYLALHELRRLDPTGHETAGVRLSGASRICSFGMSQDAYETLSLLARFGLVEAEYDQDRRDDGTYEGYSEGVQPLPNRFRVVEGGTDKPAVKVVQEVLGRL